LVWGKRVRKDTDDIAYLEELRSKPTSFVSLDELLKERPVDVDEAYLSAPEWQLRIGEAEEDIRAGRIHEASRATEMLRQLNEAKNR